MNKTQLIEKIAADSELSKAKSKDVLDIITETIKNSLRDGESVQIAPLGTFKIVPRNARNGRNPQTGEELHIPARLVPSFVASKHLKETVNS